MRNESEYIVILRGEKDLMKKDQGKMSLGARLAYSFGAFGNDSFYGLLSGYLIMFITSHLFNTGNQAEDAKMISIVTLIIMGLRIVELFIDPFIGNAIDRTKTRWGHFRPWIKAHARITIVVCGRLNCKCCTQARSCKYDDNAKDIFAYHSGAGK